MVDEHHDTSDRCLDECVRVPIAVDQRRAAVDHVASIHGVANEQSIGIDFAEQVQSSVSLPSQRSA